MTKEQEVLKDLKEVTLEELDEAIRAIDKQEQEDSIEILENTELDINTIDNVDLYTYSMAVKTVLSMLEEKDKTIDKLKKHNHDLLRKLRNRVKDVKKLQKYSLYKKEFSRLNKQLQNKDKIIDLYIDNIMTYQQAKTIRKMCCPSCPIGEKACTYSGIHRNCIKQYFENKAKEVK